MATEAQEFPQWSPFRRWLLKELEQPSGPHASVEHEKHPWWQVMCLTGVDYFSTLAYQPGIAFLATGFLSPIATLVLILVTLFAAFPAYARVAKESPDGQGSISMLERLFPRWKGKAVVLILIGFAATDFLITMTLSAADAAEHIVENPFAPPWLQHQMGTTLLLLALLGAVFLKGFTEAIRVAVVFVVTYLGLNITVIVTAMGVLAEQPHAFANWRDHLFQTYTSPLAVAFAAVLFFPKLALGLSGFETGVAVMPLIRGDESDTPEEPLGRIRNTRKLLFTAAIIMSVFLAASSWVTTLLIDPKEFQPGGAAYGRALSFIAHHYLGEAFGTVYDVSTILILAFAGASALAGLVNLVSHYLPQYGMAPEWARASRPLVLAFLAVAFTVTWIFEADVEQQGGAYATGVLVLMSSAAIGVTVSVWRRALRWVFLLVSIVFVYTALANIWERPEGLKIGTFFIVLTVFVSLLSRTLRSTELRIHQVSFDAMAESLLRRMGAPPLRIMLHRPGDEESLAQYAEKARRIRALHRLRPDENFIFLEVTLLDASRFHANLEITGHLVGDYPVLRTKSQAIPNAIAALLIELGNRTGAPPHAYFGWTEGNPLTYILRYIFLGEGDTVIMTREVLRRNVEEPARRPIIHVA